MCIIQTIINCLSSNSMCYRYTVNDLSSTFSSIDRYLALPLDEGIDEFSLDKKTLKQIRLGEMLHNHSSEARLIVM